MSNYKSLLKSVTNLEVSKALRSIDSNQEALFYWRTYETAKGTQIQLCIKDSSGTLSMLWGSRLPKRPQTRRLRTYAAYLSGEISELLRPYKLKVLCHTHEIGEKSPYVCYVETNGIEDESYPHVLEETETDAKGLMLKMLFDLKNPGW